MKLLYKKEASFVSNGITFLHGLEYEVSEEVGTKLLTTFGNFFDEIKPTEVVKSVDTDKPTEVEKPKPRAKK